MKKLRFVLGVLLVFSATLAGRETTTEIGKWESFTGNKLVFSVVDDGRSRTAQVFAVDAYLVNSVLLNCKARDLKKLQSLIAETLAEMEKPTK